MANEKRLIDANALLQEFDEYIQDNREQNSYANSFCADVCEVLKNTIVKVAPTVGAVEVVHGRWVKGTRTLSTGSIIVGHRCSECDEFFVRNSNYCPNCGAKMDGDGNE